MQTKQGKVQTKQGKVQAKQGKVLRLAKEALTCNSLIVGLMNSVL